MRMADILILCDLKVLLRKHETSRIGDTHDV